MKLGERQDHHPSVVIALRVALFTLALCYGFGASAFTCEAQFLSGRTPSEGHHKADWIRLVTANESQLFTDRTRPEIRQLIRDIQDAWRSGELRLDFSDGKISVMIEAEQGLPDVLSYEKVQNLVRLTGYRQFGMTPDGVRLIQSLHDMYASTQAKLWQSQHYSWLSSVRYTEAVSHDPLAPNWEIRDGRAITIESLIKRQLYNSEVSRNPWWIGPENYKYGIVIPPEKSRSLSAQIYSGRIVFRKIFWPAKVLYGSERPDVSRIRIAENIERTPTGDKRLSVEVLVNDVIGGAPRGFFFTDIGGELVPTLKIRQEETEKTCMRCHCVGASNRMSFKPTFISTVEGYKEAGFVSNPNMYGRDSASPELETLLEHMLNY